MRAASARSPSAPVDLQLKFTLLRNLNETVSIASRRVFQTHLLHSHSSLSAIREHLPELCAFADSLFQIPSVNGNKESVSSASRVQRHAATARQAFRDPEAQWLARSAVQSGVAALMCGQLVRCARERFAAKQDASAAQLVLLLLCDQLLMPCTGKVSGSCEWRDRKPSYHSMHCFSVWDTLLPFLERMAKRLPHVLEQVLVDFTAVQPTTSGWKRRVNCNFAHIVGLWRLMEVIGGSKEDAQPAAPVAVRGPTDEEQDPGAILSLCMSVLRFMVHSTLMNSEAGRNEDEETESGLKSASFYDDLLMEKFFSGLQEFMFYCPRSKRIARAALRDSIVDLIIKSTEDAFRQIGATAARPTAPLVPPRLAVFTAVSCLFVKGLIGDVMSNLLSHLQDETRALKPSTTSTRNGVLYFLVGLAAHVSLVPMDAILGLFDCLLDVYTSESERDTRISIAFCIVYVALHRIDALHAFREENETSGAHEDSQSNSSYVALLTFQGRFCGEVESHDFYALPLEWMELLWKEWFELSSDDIASFVTEYEVHHDESDGAMEDQEHPAPPPDLLTKCEELIPFRNLSGLFPRQLKLLDCHYIAPGRIDDALLDSGIISENHSKRAFIDCGMLRSRKKVKRAIVPVDPEVEERKLNVLMLPEVMERVCSFMSAKRLCRLAVVCKAFAEISRCDWLWQQLWIGLTSRDLEPVRCHHGVKYVHDWRLMYRKRWDARRRLRKRLRTLQASSSQRFQGEDVDSIDFGNDFGIDGDELMARPPFAARICTHCDCYERLNSQAQTDEHMQRHEKFRCTDRDTCGATFTSVTQLNKHQKMFHLESREKKKVVKERIPCSHEGCTKTYTSLKRLESHRKTHDPASVSEPLMAVE
ncbi:hypothetical protein FI667_g5867, partial [Globisporangium splendens]